MTNHRRTPLALAAAAAAALLAGCSFIPTYERPQPPVPATYAGAAATTDGAAAQPAATVPWQNYFAEPRLQQLIGIALANNRDLRVAMLNIEQAREIGRAHV